MTNPKRTCPTCGNRKAHYAQLCRPCHLAEIRGRPKPVCWWGTCDRPEVQFGLCSVHRDRARRGLEMDGYVRGSGYKRGVDPCIIDGCTRKVFSGRTGYCAMHQTRVDVHGNVGSADPMIDGRSRRWHIDKFGYVRKQVYDPGSKRGKWVTQHRVVMEEMLGRPLERWENVHHINGIRSDNRPENLELWITPQPVGQRPADLAEWVVEQYPELVTAALTRRHQLQLAL